MQPSQQLISEKLHQLRKTLISQYWWWFVLFYFNLVESWIRPDFKFILAKNFNQGVENSKATDSADNIKEWLSNNSGGDYGKSKGAWLLKETATTEPCWNKKWLSDVSKAIWLINNSAGVWIYILLYILSYCINIWPCTYIYYFFSWK